MAFVYLISDLDRDDTYKIGLTRGKIENRMKKLQTGNSGELMIIKYHETNYPYLIEKFLHSKFSSKSIRGEWFTISYLNVKKFNDYCNDYEKIILAMKENPFFNK